MKKQEITFQEFEKLFLEFLKKENIHKKYKKNIRNYFKQTQQNKNWYNLINPLTTSPIKTYAFGFDIRNIIAVSFAFSETKEGTDFWWRMNDKMNDYFKQYKIK